MIELLWLSYLIMVIFCYIIFNKDLTAPAFIFCGLYFFSISLALINKDYWHLFLSDETFIILLVGGLLFIFLGIMFHRKYKTNINKLSTVKMDLIKISSKIAWSVVLFSIITSYLQYKATMDIAAQLGVSDSALIVAAVREATSYGTEMRIPTYVIQLAKILGVISYMWLFIYINNGIIAKKNWRDIKLLFPVLIYLITNILSGNRLMTLYFAGAGFSYYYIMLSYYRRNKVDSTKILRYVILFFIVLMAGFYSVRLLAGRVGSEQTELLQYISSYAGGSIKLFDMFINDPVISDLWGKETFIPIHKTLQSWGIEHYPSYIAHKEFRELNGIGLGNVYTAYRAWYADFGMSGIVFLGGFVAAFYNCFYYKIRSRSIYNHRFMLIIYGYMSSGLFLHSIQDDFFPYFVSLGFLSILLLFWVLYYIVIKKGWL